MRAILIALLATGMLGTSSAFAVPVNGAAINGAAEVISPVQNARVFCYNRYTGRFKHWGSCRSSIPRVYCRNRYTGRFLYWGACRR